MLTRRDFFKIVAASGTLAAVGKVEKAGATLKAAVPDTKLAAESARNIPYLPDADVVVVGGTTGAVAAAAAVARQGNRVFLVASLPYLGDDICGAHLVDKQEGEAIKTPLAHRLFDDLDKNYYGESRPYRPLALKTVLENELINHEVDFLYSSYVTNVLTDENGKLAGVVITNRSGRQAIRCKGVIDATHEGIVARLMNVPRKGSPTTETEFSYTVIGNKPKSAPLLTRAEALPINVEHKGKKYPVTRYTCKLPYQEGVHASLAQAEQTLRSLTWDTEQVDSADLLWYVPTSQIISSKPITELPLALYQIGLETMQPKDVQNLWILGPCMDVERGLVAHLMRPLQALQLGETAGERIGASIKKQALADKVTVATCGNPDKATNYGKIGELLKPLRPMRHKEWVHAPASSMPVWGSYDVVVLGGGTAGATAGISAARQGAKTLVLEYLHGLGGLHTMGMIGRYWDGFRGGFTETMDNEVRKMAPDNHPRQTNRMDENVADWKMEWLRKELLQAKGELWYGVLGCGAITEGNLIKGLVVATPQGRGIILSKILIDSTGSADIAIAAGADYEYTNKDSIAVQGAGLGRRNPEDNYNNNDWLFIDDTDILDVSATFVRSKVVNEGEYDTVKIPQTRERRRIVGEYKVTVADVINKRRYADTISYHRSSFDTHGMVVDPYFLLSPPCERHVIYDADVPLRSLLPKGLDGILTTGLGACADRDAMPVIRMQPCLQNQGFAVGYLSAQCVKEGKSLRKIDIKKIQRYLVSIGNLPDRVLTDKAFKGYSDKDLQQATERVYKQYEGLEIVLTNPQKSIPMLQKQLQRQDLNNEEKIIIANILGMLGQKNAASWLTKAIDAYPDWDKGWNYTGMGQFGMSLSRLDALLMAVGKTKDRDALKCILHKAKSLMPDDYYSHFRAIAWATADMASSEAAKLLAELLQMPGIMGNALDSYATARAHATPSEIDTLVRNRELKELCLAKALVECGDYQGIGKRVMESYAQGLQGHYARFAYETLQGL